MLRFANTLLATKISFMDEIANICEKTGANIKNVSLGIGLKEVEKSKHMIQKLVTISILKKSFIN